jgi:hypothetical protein
MNLFNPVSNSLNLQLDNYLKDINLFKTVQELIDKIYIELKTNFNEATSKERAKVLDDCFYLKYLYKEADPQPSEDNFNEKRYYVYNTNNISYASYKVATSYSVGTKYYVDRIPNNELEDKKIAAFEVVRTLYPYVWNVIDLMLDRVKTIDPIALLYMCNYCYRLKGRLDAYRELVNFIIGKAEGNGNNIEIKNSNEIKIQEIYGEGDDTTTVNRNVPRDLHSYSIKVESINNVLDLDKFSINLLILANDMLFNTNEDRVKIDSVTYSYVTNKFISVITSANEFNYWKLDLGTNNITKIPISRSN